MFYNFKKRGWDNLKNVTIIGVFVVVIIGILMLFFKVSFEGITNIVKFSTLYLLPWIFLYWFIKFVKSGDRGRD